MYCNGEGVNQNHEEGVKWIHKSAVQGNKLAQQALYELVQNRQGISKNDAEQITTQRERSVRSIPKQARKTERRLELIPQTSAPPDSHFSTCRKDEYRVNGSTYVDVSSKGLWGGMLSSFFAGLNGKGVDTGWDRISGRWDAMKQDGKNHRR